MRRKLPVGIVAAACLVLMAWAIPAEAQRRVGPGSYRLRPHTRITIGAHFGPYYGPYFYSPWFYSSFWMYPGYPYGYPYYYDNGASIRIQVQPKFAQVYVDGNLAGTVDDFDGFFQSLPVPPGGHDITVYLEGYRSIVQRMYLSPGSHYRIKGVMEKLPAGEPNEPRPQPAPLPRQLRPEYPGQEPRDVPEAVQPAEPQLREPYPPVVREAPAPVERDANPPLPPDSRFGQVAIRVQPGDAQVVIDGEVWQAPQGADRLVVNLRAGTHRVEIRKEGFDPFVTAVEVKRGEVAVLNVSLARL
jgi:hypothetical protein